MPERFTKRLLLWTAFPLAILMVLIWIIAGNDRLFRSAVPIEQRLVSHNESIRKKAQQELLGLEAEGKKQVVSRLIPALDREEAFVRKWAAISLALVGSEAQEAIPVLLQTVSAREKDVAQAARVALSEIGTPDVQQLPSLLRTLQDPRDPVRCEAALSIAKMGPVAQDAAPVLLGYIRRQEATPACFEEALAAISYGQSAAAVPLIDLLGSGHPEIRRKAAHVLALAGTKSPETITALLEVLTREQDAVVRSRLAKALQLPSTPAADYLAVIALALRADHLPVRLEAARQVRQGFLKGRKTLPLILRMIRDPEAAIRRLGLETLRRSGMRSAEILSMVARVQRDSDPGVRCRAAETLVESGSVDRVSIALLIGDMRKDDDTARCAQDVLGLAGLFDGSVMRSMTRLVQEETDPDIRSRAARVLMHLGPKARDAVPALIRAQKDQIPGAEMALRAVRAPPAKKRRD